MLTTLAQLLLALAATASAQTFTNCNPLSQSCPPDPALGKSVTIDFTKGASDLFTTLGSPSYSNNGAQFTVAKSGDSPQIISKFYMMFGKFEITLQAAPGAGIVSSAVLQSDDLDEIDWEWLGADNTQVQSNYFGKGITGSYNRGAFHPAPGNQNGFHTYTVDWTASQITWQIDGATVRTLTPDAASGQYPQTPMQIKVGAWSGGDPSNAPGTIRKFLFLSSKCRPMASG
jgi:Glycosyl hydrolases family 16